MYMIVTQLENFHSSPFTLCCQVNGNLQPIADFSSQDDANYLMAKINQAGHIITLKALSHIREFCVGTCQNGILNTKWVVPDLNMALQKLGINVDFDVEPQESQECFAI